MLFLDLFGKGDPTVLWKNAFLEVRRDPASGHTYVHEADVKGQRVAVLGFDRAGRILARFERVPAHGSDVVQVALRGGIDTGRPEDARETAAKELMEEAGIAMPDLGAYIPLGTARPSKGSDLTVHLFAVDLSGMEPNGHPEGDGSDGERLSYCAWVDPIVALNSSDPLVAMMMLYLAVHLAGKDGPMLAGSVVMKSPLVLLGRVLRAGPNKFLMGGPADGTAR